MFSETNFAYRYLSWNGRYRKSDMYNRNFIDVLIRFRKKKLKEIETFVGISWKNVWSTSRSWCSFSFIWISSYSWNSITSWNCLFLYDHIIVPSSYFSWTMKFESILCSNKGIKYCSRAWNRLGIAYSSPCTELREEYPCWPFVQTKEFDKCNYLLRFLISIESGKKKQKKKYAFKIAIETWKKGSMFWKIKHVSSVICFQHFSFYPLSFLHFFLENKIDSNSGNTFRPIVWPEFLNA